VSVYRRGKRWWIDFRFRGERFHESTGTRSKTLAQRIERQRRREVEEAANGLRSVRRSVRFSVASGEWFEANRARWSESNVAIQGFNLARLNSYFGTMLNTEITASDVGKYQAFRQSQSLPEPHRKKPSAQAGGVAPKKTTSNRTINMEISTLRAILKANKLWVHIADDVQMLPERKDIGKRLSQDEAKRLLDACRQSLSPSLYTAAVIYSNTGLRNSELRCASWSQVDLLRGEFRVGKAKTAGSTGRIIPLNQTALEVLKAWKAHWPEANLDDYIFPSETLMFKGKGSADSGVMTSRAVDRTKAIGSWKRAWKTAKKQAGIECRIHDLRHHFISALAQTLATDATIKSLAGHVSHEMLEHYSHVRLEEKRRAVEALDAMRTIQ
jgi:integrase